MGNDKRWNMWDRYGWAALALAGATLFAHGSARAADPINADQILAASRARPDGKTFYAEVKLLLLDEKGGERTREVIYLQKDEGKDEKMTLYFTGPKDVKGVGFQSVNYDESTDHQDDQWIYFPAFRQVRRIATSDKRGSFMGSEFAYIDLDKLRVRDYEQKLVQEEDVLGRPCYVIERVPRSRGVIDKTGYRKTRVWVDKATHVVVKQTYYDAKGILFKEMQVKDLQKVQGIWTIMQSEMRDFVSKKQSRLFFSNVKYDLELSDKLFQRDVLRTGVHSGNLPALR